MWEATAVPDVRRKVVPGKGSLNRGSTGGKQVPSVIISHRKDFFSSLIRTGTEMEFVIRWLLLRWWSWLIKRVKKKKKKKREMFWWPAETDFCCVEGDLFSIFYACDAGWVDLMTNFHFFLQHRNKIKWILKSFYTVFYSFSCSRGHKLQQYRIWILFFKGT